MLMDIFFKVILLICGIVDAHKYYRQAQKIEKEKSSANISRFFLCEALGVDFVMLAYVLHYYHTDWVLVLVRILPIITTFHCFWCVYIYYPYLKTRPNFGKFVINSLTPNHRAERL